MITNYYTEKFFTSGKIIGKYNDKYVEIFINPTPDELKECGEAARGFIIDDNFYVAKDSDFLFHYKIWDILKSSLKINEDYFKLIRTATNVVPWQRDGEAFYLSESYEGDKEAWSNLKHNADLNGLIAGVQKKNQSIKFISKIIGA